MKFSSYQPAVAPNVMRPPAVQASGDVNAYGDVKAGAGLGQLAGAIGQVTAVLAKRQDDMDAASVMEARQKIMTSVTEQLYGQGGLFQTAQGENAKGLTERTTDTIKKTFDDVAKNYNGRVQYALKGNLNENMANFQRIAASREMQEYESTQKADYESNITNSAQLAGLTYNVKDALQNYVNDALRLTDARGAQQGWTGAQLQTERMKGITSIVAAAVGAAIDNEDYDTAGAYLLQYRKDMDQATYAKFSRILKKRNDALQMDQTVRDVFAKVYDPETGQYDRAKMMEIVGQINGPGATTTVAGGEGILWDIARKTSALTGIKPEFIYAQLYHESGGGNSQLARENLNFAGLTQVEPNGEENKQPDGGNYYRVFKNADEFAEAYAHDFLNRYEGVKDAQTVEEYATILRNNGYFTAPLESYIAGLKGALASSEGSRTVSAYDPEKYKQLVAQVDALAADAQKTKKIERENFIDNLKVAIDGTTNYSDALTMINGQGLSGDEKAAMQSYAMKKFGISPQTGRTKGSGRASSGAAAQRKIDSSMRALRTMQVNLMSDKKITTKAYLSAQDAGNLLDDNNMLSDEQLAELRDAYSDADVMSQFTTYIENEGIGGAYKRMITNGMDPLVATILITKIDPSYLGADYQGDLSDDEDEEDYYTGDLTD